jgi:ATP-dependent Clp protease protease subunit
VNNFWQFRNLSDDEGELLLYGAIQSQKSWWDEDGENIYPKQFNDDLKALGDISRLTVRINSPGGDVFAATAIYTALKNHPANVTVQVDGIAASAATIIMMAGDTIKAPSNAMIMIHDPMLMLFGYYNAQDMQKMSEVLASVKASILNAYVSKTGRDKAELADMMQQETWMTAEEALEQGFVDELMFEDQIDMSMTSDNRFMVVNHVAHDLSRFQTRPQIGRKPMSNLPAKPQSIDTKKDGDRPLEIKNLEDLRKHYPDLCNQLESEARQSENARLKAIDEIAPTLPQDLVVKAKYETPMSAQDLAFEALKRDAAAGKTFVNKRIAELEPNNQVITDPKPVDSTAENESAIVDAIAAGANKKRGGNQK